MHATRVKDCDLIAAPEFSHVLPIQHFRSCVMDKKPSWVWWCMPKHLASFLQLVEACLRLPEELRPKGLWGGEV
jgi:hypothetical protein